MDARPVECVHATDENQQRRRRMAQQDQVEVSFYSFIAHLLYCVNVHSLMVPCNLCSLFVLIYATTHHNISVIVKQYILTIGLNITLDVPLI